MQKQYIRRMIITNVTLEAGFVKSRADVSEEDISRPRLMEATIIMGVVLMVWSATIWLVLNRSYPHDTDVAFVVNFVIILVALQKLPQMVDRRRLRWYESVAASFMLIFLLSFLTLIFLLGFGKLLGKF